LTFPLTTTVLAAFLYTQTQHATKVIPPGQTNLSPNISTVNRLSGSTVRFEKAEKPLLADFAAISPGLADLPAWTAPDYKKKKRLYHSK